MSSESSIQTSEREARRRSGDLNKLSAGDRPVHDWYRFVLSFPPHLVRDYLDRFGLDSSHRVLDPFCGTGTTIVECKKHGIPSVGIEANPMAHFASQVKVDWTPDAGGLREHADRVAADVLAEFAADGIEDDPLVSAWQNKTELPSRLRVLSPESWDLLLTDSISPLPLHKTLVLLEHLHRRRDERYHRHLLLALAKALPFSISNLRFGPR